MYLFLGLIGYLSHCASQKCIYVNKNLNCKRAVNIKNKEINSTYINKINKFKLVLQNKN